MGLESKLCLNLLPFGSAQARSQDECIPPEPSVGTSYTCKVINLRPQYVNEIGKEVEIRETRQSGMIPRTVGFARVTKVTYHEQGYMGEVAIGYMTEISYIITHLHGKK
ncbi:MAG: hypothetical protein AABW79_01065 [Nanoarchaeota archaeon]